MRLIDANKIVYSWQIDADGQEHDGVTLQSIIDKMPTIEPERKTGKWITQEFGSWAECSECHELYDIPIAYSNFCPNCGAKMNGGEAEDG